MLEIKDVKAYADPNILVLGVGGGGNNALNRMIENNKFPVKYVAVNTDKMVLEYSRAENTVAIGEKLTGGYGAGGDPSIGAASAEESTEEIENLVRGSQMVIITGGMGGGTGTGAIPVIAKICQDQRVLTVAVVTKPFSFEGKKKMQLAETGIAKLRDEVDTLLVIPNDKLLEMNDKTMDLDGAFLLADSVLQHTIYAITNIICNCGTVNLDFNDLRTVLSKKGEGHLGISTGDEGGDIIKAVEKALRSPLLETDLRGASYVLVNCSGKINVLDLNMAIQHIQEEVGEDTYVMWGTVAPKEKDDTIEVTIIATGLNQKKTIDPQKKVIVPRDGVLPQGGAASRDGALSQDGILLQGQKEIDNLYRRLQERQKKQTELIIPPFLQDTHRRRANKTAE